MINGDNPKIITQKAVTHPIRVSVSSFIRGTVMRIKIRRIKTAKNFKHQIRQTSQPNPPNI
jgi:hypothetical protein